MPAPESQLLSSADRARMRSFAATLPQAHLEFAESGIGRVLAMLTMAERRFLFERNGRSIRVRDVRDRHFLAEAGTVERVLAALQDSLGPRLPGEAMPSGPTAGDPAGPLPIPDSARGDSGPDTRPRILVVEDQPYLAMELEEVLGKAGHHPLLVSDGATALAAMASLQGPVPAALVSLQLKGGMNGREVIRRLREHLPDLPVVAITGHLPLAPEADLRGLGGPTARLVKPFGADLLLQRLAEVIASPGGIG